MTRIRHGASRNASISLHNSATKRHSRMVEHQKCVVSEHCLEGPIDGAPFGICGKHLRQLYEFAADMVTENWDGAVRDYVSGLHNTFKPPVAVKQPRAGWVYFIRFGDRVKVGYTTVPKKRMTQLPHEQIIGIVPGTRDDEAAWHKLLAGFHVVGEWFRADPEVIEVLGRAATRSTVSSS